MKKERLNQIIDYIKLYHTVTISKLSKILSISEMTVRRDVSILAEQNIIKIIHGAIIYNSHSIDTKNFNLEKYMIYSASNRYVDEKRRISEKAVELIEENDIIVLDSGSTIEIMSEYLPKDKNLTVICFSLNVLQKVHSVGIEKIIFTGGYFHKEVMMFESQCAVDFMKRHRANKAFISAAGISKDFGVTSAEYYEIDIKKSSMLISSEKILVSDSSKFNKVRMANFAKIEEFDTLITDKNIPKEYYDYFKELNQNVYSV